MGDFWDRRQISTNGPLLIHKHFHEKYARGGTVHEENDVCTYQLKERKTARKYLVPCSGSCARGDRRSLIPLTEGYEEDWDWVLRSLDSKGRHPHSTHYCSAFEWAEAAKELAKETNRLVGANPIGSIDAAAVIRRLKPGPKDFTEMRTGSKDAAFSALDNGDRVYYISSHK